jgi:hypothetical protein
VKRTSPDMRDLEMIDSELRLLLAIRKMACEVDGNQVGRPSPRLNS